MISYRNLKWTNPNAKRWWGPNPKLHYSCPINRGGFVRGAFVLEGGLTRIFVLGGFLWEVLTVGFARTGYRRFDSACPVTSSQVWNSLPPSSRRHHRYTSLQAEIEDRDPYTLATKRVYCSLISDSYGFVNVMMCTIKRVTYASWAIFVNNKLIQLMI